MEITEEKAVNVKQLTVNDWMQFIAPTSLLIGVFVAACWLVISIPWNSPLQNGRFQIVSLQDGIVRMDTKTGELWVWQVDKNAWFELSGSRAIESKSILQFSKTWLADYQERLRHPQSRADAILKKYGIDPHPPENHP